jgi:hypothetical protein
VLFRYKYIVVVRGAYFDAQRAQRARKPPWISNGIMGDIGGLRGLRGLCDLKVQKDITIRSLLYYERSPSAISINMVREI